MVCQVIVSWYVISLSYIRKYVFKLIKWGLFLGSKTITYLSKTLLSKTSTVEKEPNSELRKG